MIDHELLDRAGRRITLCEVTEENWRAVADIAPFDDQRDFVAALAARYLLLSLYEGPWHSLAVYADRTIVGHVMWGRDEDGSHWVGGMLVDRFEQGWGVGRALLRTLLGWLAEQEGCWVIRTSYHPDNVAARRLHEALGFTPVPSTEAEGEVGDEADGDGYGDILAELSPADARRAAAGALP